MKRKIVVGVFAGLVLLLSGLAAPAEDWPVEFLKGALGNLKELSILVEDVDPIGKKLGLTEKGLADEILVQLRAKLPRLKIVVGKPLIEFLYLHVNIDERPAGGHYGIVLLHMKRVVMVVATAETRSASVWHEGTIFIGPPGDGPRHVREIISELVTKFAADYYRAGNP